MANGKFTEKTRSKLKQKVGGRCSKPTCRIETEADTSIGEAAHICGRTKNSARYDEQMTDAERASYENGIWLCRNCHKPADFNSPSTRVTKENLVDWKKQAEQRANHKQGTTDFIDDEEGLSNLALDILRKAVVGNTPIIKATYLGGQQIQVGNEKFGTESYRAFSKYTAVIRELEHHNFIVARVDKDEIFDITDKGFLFVKKESG